MINMFCSAGSNAEHCLKIAYGMPSNGHGEEFDRDFLIASWISSMVIMAQLNSDFGGVGDGIQTGC